MLYKKPSHPMYIIQKDESPNVPCRTTPSPPNVNLHACDTTSHEDEGDGKQSGDHVQKEDEDEDVNEDEVEDEDDNNDDNEDEDEDEDDKVDEDESYPP
jgi:hypothetical protein